MKIQSAKTISKIHRSTDVATSSVAPNTEITSLEKSDPVTTIAVDLIEGNISSAQAVDLLIEHTLTTEMVQAAPIALRTEIEQVLTAAIQTDPYLVGLTQKLN